VEPGYDILKSVIEEDRRMRKGRSLPEEEEVECKEQVRRSVKRIAG